MDPVAGTANVALLTRLLVGSPIQEHADNAMKIVRVNAEQQVRNVKLEGYGHILDALA
jgi:hypothetical protein